MSDLDKTFNKKAVKLYPVTMDDAMSGLHRLSSDDRRQVDVNFSNFMHTNSFKELSETNQLDVSAIVEGKRLLESIRPLSMVNRWQKVSKMPQDITEKDQEFLDSIKDLSDIEKLEQIHLYTTENFLFLEDSEKNSILYDSLAKDNIDVMGQIYIQFMLEDTISSFSSLSSTKYDDCDGYATYMMEMAKKSGISEGNIKVLGGVVKYNEVGGHHAVTIAEIDGHLYMLDLNMVDVVELQQDGKGDLYFSGFTNKSENVEGTFHRYLLFNKDDIYIDLEYDQFARVIKPILPQDLSMASPHQENVDTINPDKDNTLTPSP